ncbi:FOG: Predicted E3 ubiquitin ligase [Phaffia rhodozyma]|uniref:FOG: Predicted E3 ubiquitin ligase n=1 Tax=Phaffia rhodozyma TaxID=264483 RepID=A0A0F7ST94_PHARH|nr:FOG: Predicted E3 ubiquitin ligase [Phaffia rhodozyma]
MSDQSPPDPPSPTIPSPSIDSPQASASSLAAGEQERPRVPASTESSNVRNMMMSQDDISEGRARFMQALLQMGLAPPTGAPSTSPLQLPEFNTNQPRRPGDPEIPQNGNQQSSEFTFEFIFESGPEEDMAVDDEGAPGSEADMMRMANMMFGSWENSSPQATPGSTAPSTEPALSANPSNPPSGSSLASTQPAANVDPPSHSGPTSTPAPGSRPQPSRLPSFGGMLSFLPPSFFANQPTGRELERAPSNSPSNGYERPANPPEDALAPPSSINMLPPIFLGGFNGSAVPRPFTSETDSSNSIPAAAPGANPDQQPIVPTLQDDVMRATSQMFGGLNPPVIPPSTSAPNTSRNSNAGSNPVGENATPSVHPMPFLTQPLLSSIFQSIGSSGSPQPTADESTANPNAEGPTVNSAPDDPTQPSLQGRPPMPPNLNLFLSRLFSRLPFPSSPGSVERSDPIDPSQPNRGQPSFIIAVSFGGPPPMEDKAPDPVRAAELVNALDKPSKALLKRLDRVHRLDEGTDGVAEVDRQGARCAVCMESLLDDEEGDVRSLPCSHAYHENCLLPWLSTHTNCPSCRFDLDPLSTTLNTSRINHRNPFLRRGAFGTRTPTTSTAQIPSAGSLVRPHPYSRNSTPSSSRPGTPSESNPSTTITASTPDTSTHPSPRSLLSIANPFALSAESETPTPTNPSSELTYVPPPARLTLLEHLLSLERRHHLRCSMPSCIFGPSEEDPTPDPRLMFSLSKPGDRDAILKTCEHEFHEECFRPQVETVGDRLQVNEEEALLMIFRFWLGLRCLQSVFPTERHV